MEQMEFREKYKGREKVKSVQEFAALLEEAEKDSHDYGAVVEYCALMMKAGFQMAQLNPRNGITGFQAGCLMWMMVEEFGMFDKDAPKAILDYSSLIYPQSDYKFNSISKETWDYVQKKAASSLKDNEHMHPDVAAHMQTIVDGKIPFGLKLRE